MLYSPFIFGISSITLSDDEIEFFKKSKPYGIIFFKRNIKSKEQVIDLIEEIKSIEPGIKIFIDQEGGLVQRIKPPIGSKKYKPQKYFGDIYKDSPALASKELLNQYFDLSNELKEFGFDVTCAPVCDLYRESADKNVMGNRTFSDDPDHIITLSMQAIESILKAGIQPVLKHIPGHGRSKCDSHKELPYVDTELEILEATDFKVFRELCDAKISLEYAMTAHIVYSVIDNENPATLSKKVISYIRKKIGFQGKIITDDIRMKALKGSLESISVESFKAGCDIVLYCGYDIKEMESICSACSLEVCI